MPLNFMFDFSRMVHFLTLSTAFSAFFFTGILAPSGYASVLLSSIKRALITVNMVTLLSAGIVIMAQVGLMGDGWHDTLSSQTWQEVLQTSWGNVWRWQPVLAGTTLLLSFRVSHRNCLVFLLLMTAQICGLAFTGHALLHDGVVGVVQKINQSFHLLSAAYWVGGLVLLVKVMADARSLPEPQHALLCMVKFSQLGHLAVAVVLLSGLANIMLIHGWVWTGLSSYLVLLTLKALFVCLMITLALINRYWLVPQFRMNGEAAVRKFILYTRVEIVLAILVTGISCIFSGLNPF